MDYSKMKATKQTRKPSSPGGVRVSKKDTQAAKRSLGKLGISWIMVVVFLVVGVLAGWAINKFVFSKDTYFMNTYANGEADITIGKDEDFKTYTELGVKCIAFGKDYSSDCTVEYFFRDDLTNDEIQVDEIDISTPGIYYAVYTCPNFKYSSVTLIRNIIVLGVEDDG